LANNQANVTAQGWINAADHAHRPWRHLVSHSTGAHPRRGRPKAITTAPVAAQLNRDLEAEWIAKANGVKVPKARRRYDDALLNAGGLGFAYMPTPELVTQLIEEIVPASRS
jgi:hypothetical protein